MHRATHTCQLASLAGTVLRGWRVFPLSLDDVSTVHYASGHTGGQLLSLARRRLLDARSPAAAYDGRPRFFRCGASPGAPCLMARSAGGAAVVNCAGLGFLQGISGRTQFLGWRRGRAPRSG